jgi:hypothetical protein
MVNVAARWLVWIAALWAQVAWAGEARLELETTSLAAGEAMVFQVVVAGAEPRGVPSVAAPPELRVSYVGQAQTMSIVNGKAQRYVQFRYELVAREPGRHKLGPAEVTVRDPGGAQALRTEAVTVEVGPARAPGRADLPIEATVRFDAAEVWQGEVVVLSATSRSRADVLGAGWVGLPEQDLLAPRDGNPTRSEYAVRDATGVVAVDESAWPRIATTPGQLTWEAPVLQVEVAAQGGRRDLFGMLIRRTERVMVPAQPLSLTVKPRPAPPPDFSGLVGEFTLLSRLATETAQVGQSVDWLIDLQGDGTVEGFVVPPAPALEGARVYDATPQSNARVQDGAYKAALQWRRTIVPTQEGKLELPGLRVVYFSPSKGSYETLEAAGRTLRVRPGEAGAVGLTTFGSEVEAAPPEPEGPRPPRASGVGLRLPWERALPGGLLALGLPGLVAAAWTAVDALRRRRARDAAPRQATASDLLAGLPSADEPATVLDAALRLALRDRRVPEALEAEVTALSASLDQARFAGRPLPADAEARTRAIVRALEAP